MNSINGQIGIHLFDNIVFKNQSLIIDSSAQKRIVESFEFLKEFSKDKVIYGVNTGFGPMAQYKIDDTDRVKLQYNLIRSHASGMGKALDPLLVKSAMVARLNTLALGKSGVNPTVIEVMTQLINKDIIPIVHEHGGVGASGDLVQLAHLALVLIGEGEVNYKGEILPTAEVFKANNISPIQITIREGLAIMNGTSFMTGIGIVNVLHARKLFQWMINASCIINEIVEAYDDHLSEELNQAKKHKGQQEVAKLMRSHLSDSQLTRKRAHHLYKNIDNNVQVLKEKVQEYYSLRCIPQVLGPVLDTLNLVEQILIEEVNSANDNPIIDTKTKDVYHGGNFHGDYVSLEMDKLKLVVTKMSMLAERQLNYLLNPNLNNILPPFVNLGTLGLNFGMQGMQFTATSTTAENQALSTSMYIHSIPNNNDNQDIVSMGTNAALICNKVINNGFEVLTIELITLMQAIDYLKIENKVSSKTKNIYNALRKIVPAVSEDITMYSYMEKVKKYLLT